MRPQEIGSFQIIMFLIFQSIHFYLWPISVRDSVGKSIWYASMRTQVQSKLSGVLVLTISTSSSTMFLDVGTSSTVDVSMGTELLLICWFLYCVLMCFSVMVSICYVEVSLMNGGKHLSMDVRIRHWIYKELCWSSKMAISFLRPMTSLVLRSRLGFWYQS